MEALVTRRLGAAALAVIVAATTDRAAAAPPMQNVSFQRTAGYRTTNFIVQAPTQQLAQEIGDAAEQYRESLAIEWVGKPIPNWSKPCPIRAHVQAQNLGAGGATTFIFDRGEVFGWEMEIQGSRERVLDSVLPHEITHTVFASHFRKPLPRWADEGACTTVEHRSEIAKQESMLIDFLHNRQGIPFSAMFAMKEYPADILPLYAQGHSLTQYLIESHGKQKFMEFLTDGMRDDNWRRAVQRNYGHENLYALQNDWLGWVKAGRPVLDGPANQSPVTLASASEPVTPARELANEVVPSRPSVYAQQVQQAKPARMASVYGGSTMMRKPAKGE
jgi:hypothetical protein